MHGQVLCCVGRHISPPLPCSDGWVTKHLQKKGIGKVVHKKALHEISFNMKQNQNNAVIFAATHRGLRSEVSLCRGELGGSHYVKHIEA